MDNHDREDCAREDSAKEDLIKKVLVEARDYGINTVLYRHAVGNLLGVNVTDMECLALVFFKGLATPSQLSHYTGLTSGATTAMLDRLEKVRLIERRPNPNDRRGTLIVPLAESTQTVGRLFEALRIAQDKLLASYTEKELEILADYFSKVTNLWEEERQKLPKAVSPAHPVREFAMRPTRNRKKNSPRKAQAIVR